MGSTKVLVLAGILFYSKACQGQGFFGDDLARSITASVDQLNRNVQQNIQQLQSRIQENVQSQLAQVDNLTKDLHSRIAENVENADTMNANPPGGNTFLISGSGGTVRTTFSSSTQDGEYVRDIKETIMGDTLYHMEKIYDPKTKMTREYGYTLDLKDPNSKPVPLDGSE